MPLNSQESTKKSNLLDDLSEILEEIRNLPEHDSTTLSTQELEFATQELEFDDDDLLKNHLPPLDDSNEEAMTTEELIHNLSIEYSVDKKNEKIQKLEENITRLKEKEKQQTIKKQQQLDELTNDVSAFSIQIKQLISEKESSHQDLNQTHEKISDLQNELKEKKDNLIKLENKLSDFNKQLKNEIATLQTYSELQTKCVTLENKLQKENPEINNLNDKIPELKSQLKNSKQEVENLITKLEKAEQNTQSSEKQLQELKKEDKENHMPTQDKPVEAPLIDLGYPERVSPTHFDSALSSSPASSSPQTSSRSSLDFQSLNLNSSVDQSDSGPFNSSLTSDPRIYSSNPTVNVPNYPLGTSPYPSYSPVSRSRSSADLRTNFVNKQNAALVRSNSINGDLIDLHAESVEELSETPILRNSINTEASMPTQEEQQETVIQDQLSSSELQSKFKIALATKFDLDYEKVFQNLENLLDDPKLITDLLSLESEKSKRETLATEIVSNLFNHDDKKAEVKTVLTKFYAEPGFAELRNQENINKILAELITKPFVSTPLCREILTKSIDKNIENAEKLIKHAKGVINTFQEENHPVIKQAFTEEFVRIASTAAQELFRATVFKSPNLLTFKDELNVEADKEIQKLILALSENKNLLSGIIQKIHTDDSNPANYLEEVKNSASYIFGTLSVGQQNYKGIIAGMGENLIKNICIKNLQTNVVDIIKHVEQKIKVKVDQESIQPLDDRTHKKIKEAADEMVRNLLKADKLQSIIEDAKNNSTADVNLLEASKQKLQEQLEQKINENFDLYFPTLHLAPIFQKIKDNEMLSEEEIQKIPLELQYADTIEEFISGLRVRYPHLPSKYEMDVNNFKGLRLMLRKKALSAINQTFPQDNDFIDLNAKTWLEKKLQLITDKAIHLVDIELEKDQKNLLNELDSALYLSTFCDIALTPKSVTELETAIKKGNQAQLAAATQANKLFSGIENKQNEYLEINDDPVPKFLKKIGDENRDVVLKFNKEGAEKLFEAINQHLLKIGKWDYFNAKVFNYKLKDITNELLTKIPSSDSDTDAIEKSIKYAIGFLYEKNSKDKLQKEQILKDIALFYTATKKLQAFNAEIANRKVKIENLSDLKSKKDQEVQGTTRNPSATFEGIFLPHNCTIVADSHNSKIEIPISSEFRMLGDAFYSQNAITPGQTITYDQKLSNGKHKEWSVTNDATGLAYNTTSWLDKLKNIGSRIKNRIPYTSTQLSAEDREVTFAAFTHAIASSKAPVLTLSIGANCSKGMEIYLRFLVHEFNAAQKRKGQKTTILIDDNDKLKVHKDTKLTMKKEIYIKNSPAEALKKAVEQSNEINRNIISPR